MASAAAAPPSLKKERAAQKAQKKGEKKGLKNAYTVKKSGLGQQLNDMSEKIDKYNIQIFGLAMFGLALQIAVVELQHGNADEPSEAGTMIKIVITLSTLAAMGLEVMRIKLVYTRDKLTNALLVGDTWWSSGYLHECAAYIALLSIQAWPTMSFIVTMSALSVDDTRHGWRKVIYQSDEVIVGLMQFRAIFAFRVIKTYVGLSSTSAKACAMLYSEQLDTSFFFKFLIRVYPVQCVIGLFVWIMVVFSYLINVVERKIDPTYSSYTSCMWLITQTITTVGYGDFVPHSNPGRFLVALLCYISIFLLAMAVSAVIVTCQMSNKEIKVSNLLKHQRIQSDLKEKAASVIGAAWKTYLEYEPQGKKIDTSEHLAKKIRSFRVRRKAALVGVDQGEQLLFKEILNTRAISEELMETMNTRLVRIEDTVGELNEKMEGQVRDISEGIRQTMKLLRTMQY